MLIPPLSHIFLAAACCLGAISARALTAVEAFEQAPASVFPTLDRLTRLDMVDYYTAGSDRPSKNKLGGSARITELSPTLLTVQTSDVSTHTIHLLPRHSPSDTIIMVISTLKTPTPDSAVKFYTAAWKPIEKGLFLAPNLNDWVRPESSISAAEMANYVPYNLATATFVPGTGELTINSNFLNYIPSDVSDMVLPNLRQIVKYRWNGKKMVRLKDKE